jgi:hypothetical protein
MPLRIIHARIVFEAPTRVEPVRALDAIHLASALLAREVWEDLAVLSFDDRVRRNAVALGFTVVPAES